MSMPALSENRPKRNRNRSEKSGRPLTRKLMQYIPLTGKGRTFGRDELIVSKTDTTGRITYANDVFLRVAGLTEAQVLGAPHSIIRHPEMPRAVFKLLWDTIAGGNEIFAYVKNIAFNGDYYWVFAHVTPSFDGNGKIVGYHSNRRCPEQAALAKIEPLYDELRKLETETKDAKAGLAAAESHLESIFKEAGISYAEFIFSL